MPNRKRRMRSVAVFAVAAASLAAIGAMVARRPRARRLSATASPDTRFVRFAGPEAMQNPPPEWDIVDEQADQSFPASDPPGNY